MSLREGEEDASLAQRPARCPSIDPSSPPTTGPRRCAKWRCVVEPRDTVQAGSAACGQCMSGARRPLDLHRQRYPDCRQHALDIEAARVTAGSGSKSPADTSDRGGSGHRMDGNHGELAHHADSLSAMGSSLTTCRVSIRHSNPADPRVSRGQLPGLPASGGARRRHMAAHDPLTNASRKIGCTTLEKENGPRSASREVFGTGPALDSLKRFTGPVGWTQPRREPGP